jgi:hypothetical protein
MVLTSKNRGSANVALKRCLAVIAIALLANGIPVGSADNPVAFRGPPFSEGGSEGNCVPAPCKAEASHDLLAGEMVFDADVQSPYGEFRTTAFMRSPIDLRDNVSAIELVGSIRIDADASAVGENGSADTWLDLSVGAFWPDCYECRVNVDRRLALSRSEACSDCPGEQAPESRHEDWEFSMLVYDPSGRDLVGDGVVLMSLEGKGIARDGSYSKSRDTVSVSVGSGPSSGRVGELPSDPTDASANVTVDLDPLEEQNVRLGLPSDRPAYVAPRATLQASIIVERLEARIPLKSGIQGSNAPGRLRENRTIDFAGPYDGSFYSGLYGSCAWGEPCGTPGVDLETGHVHLSTGTKGAGLFDAQNSQDAMVVGTIPYDGGAEAIDVHVAVRVDASARVNDWREQGSSLAIYHFQATHSKLGGAHVVREILVRDGKPYDYYDDPAPTVRVDELLEYTLRLRTPDGSTIPPGEIHVLFAYEVKTTTPMKDTLVVPLGLAHASVSVDATIESIHVEIAPAPWPPQ